MTAEIFRGANDRRSQSAATDRSYAAFCSRNCDTNRLNRLSYSMSYKWNFSGNNRAASVRRNSRSMVISLSDQSEATIREHNRSTLL